MYDEKNEPHEFVAESRDEAIAKAARFFGTDADALACAELPPGEVYGLGGRSPMSLPWELQSVPWGRSVPS